MLTVTSAISKQKIIVKMPINKYRLYKALACGGLDTPKNMAWQTIADAKAKDRWERVDCKI